MACIFIFQYGGLSQLDSWDPKPGAGGVRRATGGGRYPISLIQSGASSPYRHFFLLVRGMAAYRTGKHAEALGVLRECQKARNPYSASTALVFEAMALHHLGQPGKARAALERADEMYRDLLASLADSPEGPLGRDWVDVLIFQIAREEAGRVMKLPVPDPR